MRFTLKVAWRYIFSKKSTNVINIISGITMSGIVIGSAALIIVLSAFNGFGDLVVNLYSAFYSEVAVSPKEGKVFTLTNLQYNKLESLDAIENISKTLQENVLLAYNKDEHIATIKGVDSNFAKVTAVDDSVFVGDYLFYYYYDNLRVQCAVLGAGIASTLNVALGTGYPSIQVFVPRRGTYSSLDPRNSFIQKSVQPVGIFSLQQEFDSKYIFTSLDFVQDLLEYKNGEISTLEIQLKKNANTKSAIKEIQKIVGDEFYVKDRFMQNEFLYKIMRNERWVVYLILTFIIIIATFNMIGSIAMLVIDKRKDIGVLRSLGATQRSIRNIFFYQGLLQTMVSIVIGFIIAITLCSIQIYFKVITIPGSDSFVVTAYPISMHLSDFILVAVTILIIGAIAAYLPAHLASQQKWMFRNAV